MSPAKDNGSFIRHIFCCISIQRFGQKLMNWVSGHLESMLLISLDHLFGYLITLSPNRPFAFNSFFGQKQSSK